MTWLITTGSALLIIGVVGRYAWPRLKFWLALTQATADAALNHSGEQVFQDNLHSLATRTSDQRGLTPSNTAANQLDESTAQPRILVL